MDIEHLSKTQIVLLTLLVSFVTSIATGIVTVSLMQQAPPVVAQTVNRVIERTIEKVTPSGSTAAVAQTKTVVVPASDLIAGAVAKVTPSVVRLYSSDDTASAFLGLGIVIDAAGTIVTDADALGQSAQANLSIGGATVRAFVTHRDSVLHLAFLSPATSTSPLPKWLPVSLSGKVPDLGSRVITLSGETVFRVGDGLISTIAPGKSGGSVYDTSIPDTVIVPGSPLFNESGSVVGISTGASRSSSSSGFTPSSAVLQTSSDSKEKTSTM